MIVILGSGRSGTTFVAKLFDSHPDVLYRHEPDSVNVDTSIPFLPEQDDIDGYIDNTKSYLMTLLKTQHPKSSAHRPIFKKSYRNFYEQGLFTVSAYASKIIEKLPVPYAKIAMAVPDFINKEHDEDIIYVIKSVNSLCRTFLFSAAFPHSKFIHVIRHPCGVIASRVKGIQLGLLKNDVYIESLFKTNEVKKYPYSFQDMVSRSLEEKMAYQWMVQNEKVYMEMHENNNYKVVKYENVCLEIDVETSRLFRFAGLSSNDQTQTFINRLKNTEGQADKYFSVVRPLSEAIDRWRGQLAEERIERILDIVSHSHVGRLYREATAG